MALNDTIARIKSIADELKAGREVEPITVRKFIWWWYAERRSHWTVWRIRRELELAGVRTVPDFESTYLDALIEFELESNKDDELSTEVVQIDVDMPFNIEDPTYRISKLRAANQEIISLIPDASLEEVITVMMENDISQIPVMANERDVKGIVTWQSIGTRLALNSPKRDARFFMEKAKISSNSESIFEIIDLVVKYDYTLVRGDDNKISGIITASDLSLQFRQLSEAFLVLSEIENALRILIERKFKPEEMQACLDPSDAGRNIQSAADLNFGEYVRLLENPKRWSQFDLRVDRVKFCDSLNRIRLIRNDVMHFDPDGIPDNDLRKIQDFSMLLRKLIQILNV